MGYSVRREESKRKNIARGRALLAGGALLGGMLFSACGGETDPDDPSGTGGQASGGAPSTGGRMGTTGGSMPSTGGSMPSTGGLPGTGGMGGDMGGMGGDMGDACNAPFEVGPCDAAFPVYFHNPATGQCENEVWGGCDGNDNRYETLEECQTACGVVPSGMSCEIDGIEYPDGAHSVPDPFSCNSCSCDDGRVTGCTEIACPDECPEGTVMGTECASCGPTDACVSVRTGCLKTCTDQSDCNGGLCSEGVCRNLCG